MIMEILTRSGGILSYLQDILGGGDSVLINKKEWGDSARGDLSYSPFKCMNRKGIGIGKLS